MKRLPCWSPASLLTTRRSSTVVDATTNRCGAGFPLSVRTPHRIRRSFRSMPSSERMGNHVGVAISEAPMYSWTRNSTSSASVVASTTTISSSTTPCNESTPTSTGFDSKWDSVTRRLLETPVGAFSATTWNEAEHALKYWFTSVGGRIRTDDDDGRYSTDDETLRSSTTSMCWKILDRLADEARHENRPSPAHPRLSTPEVLNPIVKLWRDDWKGHHWDGTPTDAGTKPAPAHAKDGVAGAATPPLLPSQLSERLFEYERHQLVRLDSATHSMILDAASHIQHNHSEGVLFADRYLQKWISDYLDVGNGGGGSKQSLGGLCAKPDIVALGTVVHAWAESGLDEAPHRAEDWLRRMLIDGDERLIIDGDRSKLYTSVILAWAKVGDPIKAQEWMDRIIENAQLDTSTSRPPDVTAWSSMLIAWANAPRDVHSNAAERAEQILQHMQDLYRRGEIADPPNVVSYSIVMDAWAKMARKNNDGAQRAERWLEEMQRVGVQPNRITYSTVINALCRAGNPQRAELILQEMIRIALEDGTLGVAPDVKTFTSVMAGWARVGSVQAAQRADALLEKMKQLNIVPNEQTYSSCINCWASAALGGNQQQADMAVQRAEGLFREMREEYHIAPDIYVCTSLLSVYGRSGQPQKAQDFLDVCLSQYEQSKDPALQPTAFTFTTVLSAWSHSKDANAARKAHELLDRMMDYGVDPNVYSYSTVLDAYARSDGKNSVARAMEFFRHMKEEAGIEPNALAYTSIIKALAKCGRAPEAEELLNEMLAKEDLSEGERGGNRNRKRRTGKEGHAKPDAYTFSSVLYAWSKSHAPDAAERAEDILVRMTELYDAKVVEEPPNLICYNSVLACWAHSRSPGAARRADDWLRVMQRQEQQRPQQRGAGHRGKSGTSLRPNLVSYNTVMNAWANEGNWTEIEKLMGELLDLSREDDRLTPDKWTVRAMWKAMQKGGGLSLMDKHRHMTGMFQLMSKIGMEPTHDMQREYQRLSIKVQTSS